MLQATIACTSCDAETRARSLIRFAMNRHLPSLPCGPAFGLLKASLAPCMFHQRDIAEDELYNLVNGGGRALSRNCWALSCNCQPFSSQRPQQSAVINDTCLVACGGVVACPALMLCCAVLQGIFRGYDQVTNVIMEECAELVYSTTVSWLCTNTTTHYHHNDCHYQH